MTVSPDLPSNMTYNCSFSGSGDIFPVVVAAIELVAGSQYQCDITDSITALDAVKLGVCVFFCLCVCVCKCVCVHVCMHCDVWCQ